MVIRRGVSPIQRRHAKNFIQAQAQARLDEAVAPYQRQGLNALGVDAHEIRYYSKTPGVETCTCQSTILLPEHTQISTSLPPNFVGQQHTDPQKGQSIKIDYRRPLFGQIADKAQQEIDDPEDIVDEDPDISGETGYSDAATAGQDCGICYRAGYVPGYQCYNRPRYVFATQHLVNSEGYTIDSSTLPHTLMCLIPDNGFVEYVITIPLMFQSMGISVRNNREILDIPVYVNDQPLTLAQIKAAAGRQLVIQVRHVSFTHLVVEFELGNDKLLANIAQLSRSLDFTRFETIGNLNVVLPMKIPQVISGDVIYVEKFNLSLKVTDVQYMQTAQQRHLNWEATTRVLQPQEALKRIAANRRIE